MQSDVRVRIAPSPTGDPHVGTAYVALFNYAFAKKNNGQFILRIEDTDQKRSSTNSERAILEAIKWLNLNWDEGPDIGGRYGPYRQSERLDIYRKYSKKLLESGAAYRCTCTPERLLELRNRQMILKQPTGYDGHCRERAALVEEQIKANMPYVVRLKVPKNEVIVMKDILRGDIRIDTSEVEDQILMKSDSFPTYHLANVVDDHEMCITHVIRGEEWISSLPKHVLLYDALGFEKPEFCHLPLLRNADKSKVSKRKNPVSLSYYREAGYLPQSITNFLGLMAYSLPSGEEFFSLNDFVSSFDLKRVSLGGPVFDLKKLLWLNGRYIREKMNIDEIVCYLQERLFSDEYLSKIVPLVRERIEKSEDFIEYADFFFKGDVSLKPENYLPEGQDIPKSIEIFEDILGGLENLSDFSTLNISEYLNGFLKIHSLKPKNIFMVLRLMVCGKKSAPPLFETLAVLGKARACSRIRVALQSMYTLNKQ